MQTVLSYIADRGPSSDSRPLIGAIAECSMNDPSVRPSVIGPWLATRVLRQQRFKRQNGSAFSQKHPGSIHDLPSETLNPMAATGKGDPCSPARDWRNTSQAIQAKTAASVSITMQRSCWLRKEGIKDGAIRYITTGAAIRGFGQRALEPLKVSDLPPDGVEVPQGKSLHLGAGPFATGETQQSPDFVQREPEVAAAADQA